MDPASAEGGPVAREGVQVRMRRPGEPKEPILSVHPDLLEPALDGAGVHGQQGRRVHPQTRGGEVYA